MDTKTLELIKQAGFEVDENGKIFIKKKVTFKRNYRIDMNEEITKLYDLLFDDFVSQWWVARNNIRLEKQR